MRARRRRRESFVVNHPAVPLPAEDGESADDPIRPAGIVTRALVAAVDTFVVFLLVALMYFGLVFVRLLFDPRAFSWPSIGTFFSVTACLGVAVIYLTFWWAMSGRTIGSALLGVRLTSHRLTVVRWAAAFARALLCVIFPFGLIWVVFDSRRRSLQDILLRTAVVYDRQPSQDE